MTIENQITQIELLIEQYEENNNPEDRIDLKQTALIKISTLRDSLDSLNLDKEEMETMRDLLDDFAEVLSY